MTGVQTCALPISFVMPVASNDTDNLFAEVDGLGKGESALALPVTNPTNQPIPEAATQSVNKANIQPVTKTEQPKNIPAQT